jgi:alcohol dehydrogenase class IV
MQTFLKNIGEIRGVLAAHGAKKPLLVCDAAFERLSVARALEDALMPHAVFCVPGANPVYEDAVRAVRAFLDNGCDFIAAVGGGSTIDTAKCVKLFCAMDSEKNYLSQAYVPNGAALLAVPTTAGTGSESTRFAVVYKDEEKQSLAGDAILPGYILLEPSVLETLPLYQKKCTMLDALCQAVESWWSVNSTEESTALSRRAVRMILGNIDGYLRGGKDAARAMLTASNLAGQAINITQTTAAHAMSYKLTSLYHIPHGHAVVVCLAPVWEYMLENTSQCADARGPDYLRTVFSDIAQAMGANHALAAVVFFKKLLGALGVTAPVGAQKSDLDLLARSVNPVRLKNNPVPIDSRTAYTLYKTILNMEDEHA